MSAPQSKLWASVFSGTFGGFLGLTLLKFGNLPIMEKFVTAPANIYEFLLGSPWPVQWAYALLIGVALLGAAGARRNSNAPRWLLVLPLAWLAWQFVATNDSWQTALSRPTCWHFAASVLCFYLGYFSLSRVRQLGLFWGALLACFLLVLAAGWQQHFGGLEETRRYFFAYIYPKGPVPPEYLKKMSSNRIFSTLFYPNALAGALLLLLPPLLYSITQARRLLTPAARWFVIVAGLAGGLGCLFWSGSKGGWLLMLLLGLIALLRLNFRKSLKIVLVCLVLATGLTGFFWKYAGFFRKGATSVSARFDYWHAAFVTTKEHPWIGTGPGTFAIPYERIKRPEAEMARLTHNDYLEQASDSGLPGFLIYTLFIVSALVYGVRARQIDGLWFLWLGLLGWALQGLIEFPLYMPALAWPAFTFFGLLLGSCRRG